MKNKRQILERSTGVIAIMYYLILEKIALEVGVELTDHIFMTVSAIVLLTVASFVIVRQGVELFCKKEDKGDK